MKYTIEDLKNGKCALVNDGTFEQLNNVLQKAFPGSGMAAGGLRYYAVDANDSNTWDCGGWTELPTQSVKDFLEEEWTPKFGELVEISTDGEFFLKRVYVGYLNGEHHFVYEGDEHNLYNNREYTAISWPKINTIRQIKQPEIEITVKINGKESKLSDISEDTLLKIRNNS